MTFSGNCMSSERSYEPVTGDRILLLTGMVIVMVKYCTKPLVSAPRLSPLLSK